MGCDDDGAGMVFTSKLPPVDIPNTDLPSFLLGQAAKWQRERPAFIDALTGRRISFGELPALVGKAASGFAGMGVRQHDVVMILAPNSPEWPIVFLGATSLGAAVTTCNPLYTATEIASQAKDSNVRLIVTVAAFVEKLKSADLFPRLPVVIIGPNAPPRTTPLSTFLEALPPLAPLPAVQIDPTDIAAIPYSSGTTGVAKGVMLTHRNLVANVCQVFLGPVAVNQLSDKDVQLAVLPFFHIYGMLALVLQPIATGATCVILQRFEMTTFLEALQKYQVTVAFVVPPVVLALAKHPLAEVYDFSKLRGMKTGAAPIGSEVIAAVKRRLNLTISQGYGMTELSPSCITSLDLSSNPEPSKPGSVGFLIPNTEAIIIDLDSGKSLSYNQRGELCIRGPQVMKGYLNNVAATAATLDAEGWLHTGDVAVVDSDGEYFIVDRLKELIKYKGFQVPPAELEALLISNPAIADAAVVGLPNEEAGELPLAFVVLAPRASISAEEIMTFVEKKVASYKKVRQVRFVKAIPRSPAGKILRKDLRAQLLVRSAL